MRTCRAFVAAAVVLGSVFVLPRPAAAAFDGYAGTCSASGLITFSPEITLTSTGSSSALFNMSGTCTLVELTPPGVRSSVPFAVTLSVSSPVATCASAVMTGTPKFAVNGDQFMPQTVAEKTNGVMTLTGSSVNFAVVGDLVKATGGCPSTGGWSGTFIVEDPTVDGVIDGVLNP